MASLRVAPALAVLAIALSAAPLARGAGEPVNDGPPQVTRTGLDLRTSDGSWIGQTEPFAYEWLRCTDTTLGSCSPISGETRPDYEIRRADIGSRLRSRVTARNPAGSASAPSEPTGVVTERLFPAPPEPELLTPRPRVTVAGLRRGRFTFLEELTVRGPRSALVRLRCRGRLCPFSRLVTPIGAKRRVRLRRAERTYRAGQTLEIRVVDPKKEKIGRFARVRFRKSALPVVTFACLRPGATQPSACPS